MEVLHAIPKDSLFTATITLPDGEKRWHQILALADSIARKAGAAEQLPSKQVEAVEGVLGLKFDKDVFGKIGGATFALLPPAPGAKEPQPSALLLVEATDTDGAKALEELLPKVVGLASGGETPSPTTERIQGQRVRSLSGDSLPWRSALHYGHEGKWIVLGQERKAVARALADTTGKGGLLGEANVAAALKGLDEPFAVAVWPVGKTALYWLSAVSTAPPAPAFGGPGIPAPPPAPPGPGGAASEEKVMQEMSKAFDPLPPLVITLTRKPDSVVLRFRQADLRPVSAKVINALVEGSLQLISQRQDSRFGAMGAPAGVAPPLPPPPPKR
jgi:hypothetical protein